MKPEMLAMLHRAISMSPVVLEGEPLLPRVTISVPTLEAFSTLVIADFLDRTGQYVTNDASREAAIASAVEAEREACAKVCDAKSLTWRVRPVPLLGYSAELGDCAAAIRARGAP